MSYMIKKSIKSSCYGGWNQRLFGTFGWKMKQVIDYPNNCRLIFCWSTDWFKTADIVQHSSSLCRPGSAHPGYCNLTASFNAQMIWNSAVQQMHVALYFGPSGIYLQVWRLSTCWKVLSLLPFLCVSVCGVLTVFRWDVSFSHSRYKGTFMSLLCCFECTSCCRIDQNRFDTSTTNRAFICVCADMLSSDYFSLYKWNPPPPLRCSVAMKPPEHRQHFVKFRCFIWLHGSRHTQR